MAIFNCPYCNAEIPCETTRCSHCNNELVYHLQVTSVATPKALHHFILTILRHDPQQRFSNYSEAKHELSALPKTFEIAASFYDANRIKESIQVEGVEMSPILQKPKTERLNKPPSTPKEAMPFGKRLLRVAAATFLFALLTTGVLFVMKEKVLDPALNRYHLMIQESLKSSLARTQETRTADAQKPAESSVPRSEPVGGAKENAIRMLSATVFITDGFKLGSGFFVSSDGYILTNRHVVDNMSKISVTTYDHVNYTADLVTTADKLDLALLKISGQHHTLLPMGDATRLTVGDTVYIVGNPRGLSFSMSKGIVSSAGRSINGLVYIQSDASINPGNSGGPMINSNSEIVGINTLIVSQSGGSEGLGFTLPINYAYQDSDSIAANVIEKPPSFERIDFSQPQQLAINAPDNLDLPYRQKKNLPHGTDEAEQAQLLLQELKRLDEEGIRKQSELQNEYTRHNEEIEQLQGRLNGSVVINEQETISQEISRVKEKIRLNHIKRLDVALHLIRNKLNILERLNGLSLPTSDQQQLELLRSKLNDDKRATEERLAAVSK